MAQKTRWEVRRTRRPTLWGLDVETVWVPFFRTTNAAGITTIPEEALREIQMDKQGRLKAHRELENAVRVVRASFEVALLGYVKQGATLKRLDLETPQWVKDLTVSGR